MKLQRFFPADKQAARMVELWREWHLNDMQAGSPRQREWLKANPIEPYDYTKASDALTAAGLNPDTEYLHEGKPYTYGRAWLKRELPPEVLQEIMSWKSDGN